MAAESIPPAGERLGRMETRSGWQITLEEARIVVGPIYLFTNSPPSASRWLPLGERLLGWMIPRALAHSGFDQFDGGEVKGEYLGQLVIDALHPGVQPIATLRGIAGPIRSATLELNPAAPSHAFELHGHHVWVRGLAVRGDESIRFEGGLDLPDDGHLRKVVGIPADLELGEGSAVVLELHVERWFAEADFSTSEGRGVDETRTIDAGTQVHAAWLQGVRGYGTFTIR